MRSFVIAAALCLLPACAQIGLVASDIDQGVQAACADVAASAKLFPASPVVTYANAACPLGTAAADLTKNSATIQWLGQINAQLQAAKPAKTSWRPNASPVKLAFVSPF